MHIYRCDACKRDSNTNSLYDITIRGMWTGSVCKNCADEIKTFVTIMIQQKGKQNATLSK